MRNTSLRPHWTYREKVKGLTTPAQFGNFRSFCSEESFSQLEPPAWAKALFPLLGEVSGGRPQPWLLRPISQAF